MSTELLHLVMEFIIACAILSFSNPAGAASSGDRVRARTKPGTQVTLKAEPVEATLELNGEAPKGLTEHVKGLKAGAKLHLVLLGLGTDKQPGVLYAVYLDLPPKATPGQKRAHSVGAINFFNFTGHETEEAKKSPNRRR